MGFGICFEIHSTLSKSGSLFEVASGCEKTAKSSLSEESDLDLRVESVSTHQVD